MSPKVQKAVYAGLASVNAVLLILQQQDILPPEWSHGVALVSVALMTAERFLAGWSNAPNAA